MVRIRNGWVPKPGSRITTRGCCALGRCSAGCAGRSSGAAISATSPSSSRRDGPRASSGALAPSIETRRATDRPSAAERAARLTGTAPGKGAEKVEAFMTRL
jgi:hypothetical protein